MILPLIFAAMMSCVLVLWGVFLMWPEIEKLFIKKKESSPAPSSISFDSTIVALSVPPSPVSIPPSPEPKSPSRKKKPETPPKKPETPPKKPETPPKKPDAPPPKKPDAPPPKKPDAPPKKPDQPITPPKSPEVIGGNNGIAHLAAHNAWKNKFTWDSNLARVIQMNAEWHVANGLYGHQAWDLNLNGIKTIIGAGGENACWTTDPTTCVNAWLASSGHRKNMEDHSVIACGSASGPASAITLCVYRN